MWQIISEYIGLLIMMVGVYIFGRIVLEKKDTSNLLKDIILILLFTIPQTIVKLNFDDTIKSLLITLINIIFINKEFKINYKKSLFLTCIYMITILIPEMLEMVFITKILNLDMNFCYNWYGGTILANLTTCILFVIITIILKKHFQNLVKTEIDNNKKIIILSSLTLISVFIFFYEIWQEYGISQKFWVYILIIIILVSVLLDLIKQTLINNKITKEYDQLLEFMTTYEEEVETQRTLRHETKNEFLAIRAKICDKEKESEIINYIDEILGDTYSVKKEKYAKFGYLPANGIKGLCYFKVQKAEELGIKVSINISKKIKNSTVFDLDLKQQREFAKILGVFIDNAIEASSESEDKELGIEAYSNLENEFRMIISNTYNNEIDEEKIGKESFTTKGKNRGHGLLLVNQIVQKNNIFETKRNIKNDIYSQTIIVKKSTCN